MTYEAPNIFDQNGNLESRKFYFSLYGALCSTLKYSFVAGAKFKKKIFEKYSDEIRLESKYENIQDKYTNNYINYSIRSKRVLFSCDDNIAGDITIHYDAQNMDEEFFEDIRFWGRKFRLRIEVSKIHVIVQEGNNLGLRNLPIPNVKLNTLKNYNEDFIEIDKIIKERLNKPKDKGVVLLYGEPGTGKTTYIRHLINSVKKRVIFVPPSLAHQLTEPGFINFLMGYPDSVLVIEDSENIIRDRETSGGNNTVSNLLNISDGLLSDILNIQLICTFNSDITTIDKALLRKGRIIAKYEFKKLNIEKCNVINKELGFEHEITSPMTLSDLYNQEDGDFSPTIKKKIGF